MIKEKPELARSKEEMERLRGVYKPGQDVCSPFLRFFPALLATSRMNIVVFRTRRKKKKRLTFRF